MGLDDKDRLSEPDDGHAQAIGRQTRQAAVVIAVAAIGWTFANWAGKRYNWPSEYALLLDVVAIAAFVWALLVTLRVWRAGRG